MPSRTSPRPAVRPARAAWCAGALVAAVLAGVPHPASAVAAGAPHTGFVGCSLPYHPRSLDPTPPIALAGSAPALHPEGIDFDPVKRVYVMSSLRHGSVSVVHRDGTVRTLVDDPRNPSTIGLRVDAVRRRVLVAVADPGVGVHTDPATQGKTAVLAAYDLDTGRPLWRTDLGALVPGDGHFANDIALAPDGTAYVTDSLSPTVYRVSPTGRATVFVHDERLRSDDIALNGIVRHPRGFLVVGKYDDGRLFRINTGGTVTEVALDRPLPGVDGLALRRDGSVVAVRNALGNGGVDAVALVRADRDWTRARVVTEVPSPDTTPTTATVVGGRTYVLSGRVDILLGGSTVDTFTVRCY